jgi:cytosine/adenosine deaminase-related metal-dependent hydrolase
LENKTTASNDTQQRLIIKDATVVTMDARRRILSSGTIVIEDGEIAEVLASDMYLDSYRKGSVPEVPTRIISASKMIAIPGLINTHTHVSEILLRGGLGADRDLYDWQWNITYPAIRAYQDRDSYLAALLYSIDALKAGTTTFVDNANTSFNIDLVNASLRAYERAGVRAVLARIFATGPLQDDRLLRMARLVQGPNQRISPADTLENLDDVSQVLEDLMKSHNTKRQGRIRIWPAPHKPNRTSVESIEMSYEFARRYDTMVSQPCSEIRSESEVDGLSSVEFLYRCGLLNARTLLGHCVYVSDHDLRMIKSADARVAHLPVANLYLGSGIAPIPAMLSVGITVGLGTDNANCNDSTSMLREMTLAALLHKGVARDAGAITAEQVLQMATIGAARAIGEDSRIGSIEKGKRADIVLIDTQKIHMTPLHSVIAGLVYQANGSEVDTVIVDGQVLVERGNVTFMSIEEEAKLRLEAQQRSVELMARIGLL